jgi:hypothetical protein
MDNIIIKKIYTEDNLLQIRINSYSQYISIWQDCIVDTIQYYNNLDLMLNFLKNKSEKCYVEFGHKTGNYTPAFSMNINKLDNLGHYVIELDMEICDNINREHRCMFNIKTEYGQLENFIKKLKSIDTIPVEYKVSLDDY